MIVTTGARLAALTRPVLHYVCAMCRTYYITPKARFCVGRLYNKGNATVYALYCAHTAQRSKNIIMSHSKAFSRLALFTRPPRPKPFFFFFFFYCCCYFSCIVHTTGLTFMLVSTLCVRVIIYIYVYVFNGV